MSQLSRILSWCQQSLFPTLEETVGQLSPRLKRFIMVIETVPLEDHLPFTPRGRRGRPQSDRRSLARAFIAKAVFEPAGHTIVDGLPSRITNDPQTVWVESAW